MNRPKAKTRPTEGPTTRSIRIPEEWHRILRFISANEDMEIGEVAVEAFRKAGLKERAEKAKV